MGKTVLGLDLGTHTGFAIGFGQGTPGRFTLSGTWSYKLTRFDSPAQRYKLFEDQLTQLDDATGVDVIYYEKVVRHLGTTAAHVYGAFLNKLHEWADAREIRYVGVPVQTIKIFATGKGNAPKARMIEAARMWGFKVSDDADDEADAIALMKYGIAKES